MHAQGEGADSDTGGNDRFRAQTTASSLCPIAPTTRRGSIGGRPGVQAESGRKGAQQFKQGARRAIDLGDGTSPGWRMWRFPVGQSFSRDISVESKSRGQFSKMKAGQIQLENSLVKANWANRRLPFTAAIDSSVLRKENEIRCASQMMGRKRA